MAWRWFMYLALLLLTVEAPNTVHASAPMTVIRPALGRPFQLGHLYNLKNDNIIMGPKLWTAERLANYSERVQRGTKYDVCASEDNKQLNNHFQIDAWLSLSFMAGLVKVSGAAGTEVWWST